MTDREQCFRIYRDAFGEDPVFDSELFGQFFGECRYLTVRGRVASMFFAFPCVLHIGEKKYPARYLYAAATDREMRGQGFMSKLLSRECADSDEVWILKPSEDALIGFYRRHGFRPVHAKRLEAGEICVTVSSAFRMLARDDLLDGREYTAMYRSREPLPVDNLSFGYVMD